MWLEGFTEGLGLELSLKDVVGLNRRVRAFWRRGKHEGRKHGVGGGVGTSPTRE